MSDSAGQKKNISEHQIKVTGHRGAAGLAPENTLAGFQLARDLGCHAVELDVHLTRDGRLAVIHDAGLERTTDGAGMVASYTLEELKALDAGNGERIPSLEEVIGLLLDSSIRIQIELKGPGSEEVAPKVVGDAGIAERITFTSFHHLRVLKAKEGLPEVTTGILISSNPVDPWKLLEASGCDNLHVNQTRIDKRIVDAIHERGRKLIAWGRIVEIPVIDRLADLGVYIIGSDRPDLVIDRLSERSQYTPPVI